MFYGATGFNSPLGKWNTKSITNMENMFREATAFNQDISSWDVNNVTQMKGMFQDATSFNQDLTNWTLNEKLPKSRTMFQGATAFNNKEHNPFLNKKAKKREVDSSTAKLSSEDKKTISKIKKLLSERDFDKIDLGIELLISLNNYELFESLLHDCKIIYSENDNGENKLVRNKLFTGSGPAQPYLDYALINVIANAPENVKKDETLMLNNITSFNPSMLSLKFDYSSSPKFLPLEKFHSLSHLNINLSDFKLEEINLYEDFKNKNITSLKVFDVEGSLKWLENFKQLKVLDFSFSTSSYGLKIEHQDSFHFLENLEYLELFSTIFEDLSFLNNCKKLKELNLQLGTVYGSDEAILKNLDFLNNFKNLEKLTISRLENETCIDGIVKCENLKHLSLTLTKGQGFNIKTLRGCKSLQTLNIQGLNSVDLEGDLSELGNLKVTSNLSKFSSGFLSFSTLQANNDSINEILKINQNLLTDVGDVTHYKGSPFTGVMECGGTEHNVHYIFYSHEMINGYKHGSKIEYYTSGERRGKAQVEQYYENDKFSKIIGIFNDEGENIINDNLCIHSSFIEHKNDLFHYNDSPYSGFCYLKFKTYGLNDGRYDEWNTLKNNTIDELLSKYSSWELTSYNESRTILFILNLKNGIISNKFSVLNSKSCFEDLIIADEIDIKSEPVYNWIVNDNSSKDGKSVKLDGKNVVITGVFENHSREELKNIIISNGGKPSSSVSASTSLILAGSKVGPNKMVKAKELNIEIINENDFIEKYNSNSDDSDRSDEKYFMELITEGQEILIKNKTNAVKLSSEDKKSFVEVKKLLASRDLKKIDDGIRLLISLNKTEFYETLLNGCKLTNSYSHGRNYGKLIKNKLFTGSAPAQPFLDYALFCVIANCHQDSKIDSSLLHVNLSSINTNDFLSQNENLSNDNFPPILKFTNLDSLIIDFKIFEHPMKGADNEVERKDWFKGNKIKSLDILSCSGSLKWLKNFTDLKKLDYKYGYREALDYNYFEYLINLEELKLVDIKNTKNLNFIKNSKKLKKLTLEFAGSYGNNVDFEDLNVLSNFINLEEISIKRISNNVNLSSISKCIRLKKLSINFDTNRNDNEKLEDKLGEKLFENCKNLKEINITGLQQINLKASISDLNGLSGLRNLKKLKIDNFIINGIDDKVFKN